MGTEGSEREKRSENRLIESQWHEIKIVFGLFCTCTY